LLASAEAVSKYGLKPIARLRAAEAAGVAPRIMGVGPVEAVKKLLGRLKLSIADLDLIELNEAFAVQVLACTRQLGLDDQDPRLNPNGGAIALGHPLGMTGARLLLTAAHELQQMGKNLALCTLCVGVGQGVALVIERV
jgi:acetyl-CoA C-acetyltransferase